MSELIVQNKQGNIRFGLLATTSAVALIAYIASVPEAIAADRPAVWLEGGWQMDSVTDSSDIITPAYDDLTTKGYSSTPTVSNFLGQGSGGFPSFTDIEKALGRSGTAEGSISFQPKGSDWIFNISGRYGRAHSRHRVDDRQDVYGRTVSTGSQLLGFHAKIPYDTTYVMQANENSETHTVLDFQVGKDVGIGLLGNRTDSVFSLGARYAQINMSSKGHSYAHPGVRIYGRPIHAAKYQYKTLKAYQTSSILLQRNASFHGFGPAISWSNTTGLIGDPEGGQIALDWGANAALLFGRQKAQVNYNTVAGSHYGLGPATQSQHRTVYRNQSRRVTVPNLGGFAALSYRFTNAKMSFGYRADFFFGAMDRGLDTHHSVTTGYHGPYATISIGLGG